MGISELLHWQWKGYPNYHASRANLFIHVVAVPVFVLANISLLVAVFEFSLLRGVLSLTAMALAFGLQARGHAREKTPAVPFSSPANAIARIFLEQWINFPRFVFSGGWFRALQKSTTN
jgi:Protein of unknown function (DUF962)